MFMRKLLVVVSFLLMAAALGYAVYTIRPRPSIETKFVQKGEHSEEGIEQSSVQEIPVKNETSFQILR